MYSASHLSFQSRSFDRIREERKFRFTAEKNFKCRKYKTKNRKTVWWNELSERNGICLTLKVYEERNQYYKFTFPFVTIFQNHSFRSFCIREDFFEWERDFRLRNWWDHLYFCPFWWWRPRKWETKLGTNKKMEWKWIGTKHKDKRLHLYPSSLFLFFSCVFCCFLKWHVLDWCDNLLLSFTPFHWPK